MDQGLNPTNRVRSCEAVVIASEAHLFEIPVKETLGQNKTPLNQ